MRLANVTCKKVEEYLTRSQTVVIPVGSIENHGKHMPLGTDTLIPDKIVELLEEKSGVMIAPTIPYGATNTIMGCTGTITLGTDGLVMILTKVTDSLFRYGFRKFVILNGHGGNNKAIETVGMQLHRRGAWLANLNWMAYGRRAEPGVEGRATAALRRPRRHGVDPSLIVTTT